MLHIQANIEFDHIMKYDYASLVNICMAFFGVVLHSAIQAKFEGSASQPPDLSQQCGDGLDSTFLL